LQLLVDLVDLLGEETRLLVLGRWVIGCNVYYLRVASCMGLVACVKLGCQSHVGGVCFCVLIVELLW